MSKQSIKKSKINAEWKKQKNKVHKKSNLTVPGFKYAFKPDGEGMCVNTFFYYKICELCNKKNILMFNTEDWNKVIPKKHKKKFYA